MVRCASENQEKFKTGFYFEMLNYLVSTVSALITIFLLLLSFWNWKGWLWICLIALALLFLGFCYCKVRSYIKALSASNIDSPERYYEKICRWCIWMNSMKRWGSESGVTWWLF
ncbi:unnamed protein product [Blepharisma stoltei]|uniref:Uncharacterized protein n=1 Tax=Blepharisma stoltei TaxID=1481888 RepID=A0AAU9JID9_9CILI|nr:unnamed protein product [Blepharisma stoltei]